MDVQTVILSGAAGVLAWFAANWIGKPIVDARDKRLKALQAAEQNSHIGGDASNARQVAARTALNEAQSDLRSISRGQWPVRLYCWFVWWDLEAAANALITLHNMIGNFAYDDEGRQYVLDTIYVLLGADRHLKRERVDEIRRQMERDKRLSKAKF